MVLLLLRNVFLAHNTYKESPELNRVGSVESAVLWADPYDEHLLRGLLVRE